MNLHQGFNTDDQKIQCPYCRTDLSDKEWHTHFESVRMYKAFHCTCGKFLSVPVKFLGSGHDNWDKKNSWIHYSNIKIPKVKEKIKSLESRIKILKDAKTPPHP
jgi:hypothetical protein